MNAAHSRFLAICMLSVLFEPAALQAAGTPPDKALQPNRLLIADFSAGAGRGRWQIEDDVVMGGRSQGNLIINESGHAVFSGYVSLENNGGFSSAQFYFSPVDVSAYRTAVLRLKGDGKAYQFIVESRRDERHYYAYVFQTGTDWQTIRIPLKQMYPVFRGRRLQIADYPAQTMSMVRFLIANNRAEEFRLEIDAIWLE